MKRSGDVCKKYIPLWVRISFVLLIVSSVIYFIAIRSASFADFINGSVSVWIRAAMSYLTYLVPFSVFELLIILILPAIIILIIKMVMKGTTRLARFRTVFSLLGIISLIFSSYIFMLGIGYRTTPIAGKIGLTDRSDISTGEIYRTISSVQTELNILADELDSSKGQTFMPYSMDELNSKLIDAYDTMNGKYDIITNFTSRVKPVYFSTVMSDLRIAGIYSFFTGEANVNVEYPDYVLPYTAAHELAHQRGICRENEANFIAFLVCISSDDAYIRYSGYLNIYEYLASAMYRADKELYYELYAELSLNARRDIVAANAVYNAHKDSFLGELNDKINDRYLKLNGTQGVVSYGYVVRLAVSYYEEKQ